MPTAIVTSPPLLQSDGSDSAGTALREAAPRSEERLLAYSIFAAGFVHDVNSPLGIALLSVQVALRSLSASADARARRCLELAIDGIETASRAMRGISLKCCDRELPRCRFDAGDVLRFTIAVMKDVADRNGCHIEYHNCESPTEVFASPLELQFAFADLMYGAIARGARLITIRLTTDEDGVEIAVADDSPVCLAAEDDSTSYGKPQSNSVGSNSFMCELIASNGGLLSSCAEPNARHNTTIWFPRPI